MSPTKLEKLLDWYNFLNRWPSLQTLSNSRILMKPWIFRLEGALYQTGHFLRSQCRLSCIFRLCWQCITPQWPRPHASWKLQALIGRCSASKKMVFLTCISSQWRAKIATVDPLSELHKSFSGAALRNEKSQHSHAQNTPEAFVTHLLRLGTCFVPLRYLYIISFFNSVSIDRKRISPYNVFYPNH